MMYQTDTLTHLEELDDEIITDHCYPHMSLSKRLIIECNAIRAS